MAFLTQKDFFRIGFPSDDLAMRREPTQASTHLKGYASCMDTRAWSFQKHAQARFVSDEVHRMDDGNIYDRSGGDDSQANGGRRNYDLRSSASDGNRTATQGNRNNGYNQNGNRTGSGRNAIYNQDGTVAGYDNELDGKNDANRNGNWNNNNQGQGSRGPGGLPRDGQQGDNRFGQVAPSGQGGQGGQDGRQGGQSGQGAQGYLDAQGNRLQGVGGSQPKIVGQCMCKKGQQNNSAASQETQGNRLPAVSSIPATQSQINSRLPAVSSVPATQSQMISCMCKKSQQSMSPGGPSQTGQSREQQQNIVASPPSTGQARQPISDERNNYNQQSYNQPNGATKNQPSANRYDQQPNGATKNQPPGNRYDQQQDNRGNYQQQQSDRMPTNNQIDRGNTKQYNSGEFGAMSKDELIRVAAELSDLLAQRNAELQRIDQMLGETVDKLPNMQALFEENQGLKRLLQEAQASLGRLNNEQELVHQSLRRRSQESNYGRIREDYERRRDAGNLGPEEEVAFLKQQLKAMENDANRAAVAEARAQVCTDELERLRKSLRSNQTVSISVAGSPKSPAASSPGAPSPATGPQSTDCNALQARIRQLEMQLVALQNYEDEYNRIRSENERQVEQLHACSQERDRLRTQLDKMTSIEGKLVALKNKAASVDAIGGQCDELAEQLKLKERQIAQLHRDKVASKETLDSLQREKDEMQLKALAYQKDAQAHKEQLEAASSNMIRLKSLENDVHNSRTQLNTAESAISEYERDIQVHIESINMLKRQIATEKREKFETEKRLQALNELELEVNALQTQLSLALQQQRTQPMADLLSAVKLTLLYVQNKLTSRETLGNEEELERLKAELLNLRERRESDALQHSRQEIDRLKKLVNQASRERVSQDVLRSSIDGMVAATASELRTEIKKLRRQLVEAGDALKPVIAKAKVSIKELQSDHKKSLETSRNVVLDQQSTIKDLHDHIEQSSIRLSNVEQDLTAQVQELELENHTLRDQIVILNGQMDELARLIEEIERERKLNNGLQTELEDFQKTLDGLPHEIGTLQPLRETQQVNEALCNCADKLDEENLRTQKLIEQNAELKAQVIMLKEKLRRFVSRASELELADVTSVDLATRIVEANKINVQLQNELVAIRSSEGACDCMSPKKSKEMNKALTFSSETGHLGSHIGQKGPQDIRGAGAGGGARGAGGAVRGGGPVVPTNRDEPGECSSTASTCPCGCVLDNDASDEQIRQLQNFQQDEQWRDMCTKILYKGIGSLNLRELSQLHHMIYLAGFRYKHEIRERRHGHDTACASVNNKRKFYLRKEREHEMKVYELQKQLTEIKNVMTSVRRNETCRVKKERVLMDAYQLLNGDDDKTCACPADNNRARPTEKRRRGRQTRCPGSATNPVRPSSGTGNNNKIKKKRSRSAV